MIINKLCVTVLLEVFQFKGSLGLVHTGQWSRGRLFLQIETLVCHSAVSEIEISNMIRVCFAYRAQVSTLRNSRSDDKKFYIYTGTKTLHLRAETSADRCDWYSILTAAKELFPRNSMLIGLVAPSEEITISTDKLREKLLEFGLSEENVKECEDVMLAEFSDVKEQLKVMQQRRLTLLERLRLVEVLYCRRFFILRICTVFL